jgi:O-antigen/teichoic acid export membrane protein
VFARKLLKEIGWVTLARVLVIACQLINIKLYTNYLSVEQLGFYFFLLTLSFFANALIFGPVDYFQQANLAKIIKITGGVLPLLKFNFKLMAVYLLIVLLLSIISMFVAPQLFPYIISAALLAIAQYIVQALRNTLNNLEHKGLTSFSLVQEAVVKILVFLILVKYFVPSALLLMASWLIALGVTALSLAYQASKLGIFVTSEKYIVKTNEIFHFSYPISVGAVCNWVQIQGYRLVLVPLGFTEMVGIFATLSSIGSAGMAAAAMIYSQTFSPLIYKTSGQYTAKYLQRAIVLIGFVLLLCILLGDFVVQIATNLKFEPYWYLMIYGVLADGSNLLIGALAIHITLTSSTKNIMTSSVLGVITLFVSFGLLFLTHAITVYTIGIPLVFSQFVVIAYMYWNFKKCTIS